MSEVFPPKIGGSGRWLWELYRRMPELVVHVAAGPTPGSGRFDATAELPISRLALRFTNWGLIDPRGVPQYARALFQLNRLVSRTRPTAIHCGKVLPEGMLGAFLSRFRRLPFYCYAHGEELTLAQTSRELRRLGRSVIRAASLLIANSDHTRRLLTDQWAAADENVVVLHPGVDATRYVPAPPDESLRARLGWTRRRVILTVGALQKRKGQDMLIRALPRIRERCPDVLYSMVGEGWERSHLDGLVAEHGVADLVQFRGIPDDDELIRCYQQCDLFVLPNRQVGWDFEGFGIALLEAQACGKAVIAGKSGGTSEAIQPSRTGELVPCDDPGVLADVIVSMLNDAARRAALGARGREWILERFDWPVLSRQAAHLFSAQDGRASVPAPPGRNDPSR